MKRFKIKKRYLLLALILIGVFLYWQNNCLVVTNITYKNENIPESFNGYKIVQISDLHNKRFGDNQKYLLEKIEKIKPDIIVVTGDVIDRREYNLEVAMEFIRGAVLIAPVYYVSGNHEAWSNKYVEIKRELEKAGVEVLDDTSIRIYRNDEFINLVGLSDPDFLTSDYLEGTDSSKLEKTLIELSKVEGFKILLSHRPELIDIYAENDIELVLSGHAHGGQIRLPFIGGLVAPDQGLLPKYTSGTYTNKNTTMVVSRGLGNSVFPFRIFNRPEIVVVSLVRE